MSSVAVYNLEGKKVSNMELDDAVFGVEIKPEVVQFVVTAQRANAHIPYAHAKTRADVRGGGKKPWRQKGTGRARHGSSRSPIWKGGGVTFGPTKERNMEKKVNKKTKQLALKMVLTDKAGEQLMFVVDSLATLEGKTKQLATLFKALGVTGRSSIIATGEKNETLQRASRNLERTNTVLANSLNVGDMVQSRFLIIDKAGVEAVTTLLK